MGLFKYISDYLPYFEKINIFFNITTLEAEWVEPVSLTFHSAKQFQRGRFFRNQPIRNKNCMWWPCLLTDRDEISNLHRGHSIDDSYQASVVAMFVNRSGRNEQSA